MGIGIRARLIPSCDQKVSQLGLRACPKSLIKEDGKQALNKLSKN